MQSVLSTLYNTFLVRITEHSLGTVYIQRIEGWEIVGKGGQFY